MAVNQPDPLKEPSWPGLGEWWRIHFSEDPAIIRPLPTNMEYVIFVGLAVMLLLLGVFFSTSLQSTVDGFRIMLTHPVTLDFDALSMAGYGPSFLNAGLLLLLALLLYRVTGTSLQGVQIAAVMMVTGFAFYGKNPVNICFPVIGVLLNARVHRQPMKDAMALAFFSTSLAPVFNVTAFGTEALLPGSLVAILLGALLSTLSGFMVGVFATYLPKLHKGRVLYNAGFAAGLSGLLINAIQSAFGIGHAKYPYQPENYVSGDNVRLSLILAVIFLYFIVVGVLLRGGSRFRKLLWYRCFGGDFIQQFGFSTSLVNMGTIGMLALLYVLISWTGQIGGPIFACILTAVGFASAGVTVREYLPTMLGVFLAAFITGGTSALLSGESFLIGGLLKVGSRPMLLAAVFSCGLAPAVGTFGWLAGIFVGALHSLIVPHTGSLHGWMSLYNNGFSMGLIVVFFFPMYRELKLGRKEKEIHIGPED